MATPPTIISERVDDIPLLYSQLDFMSIPTLIDTHFPSHGNRQGISLGKTTCVWLSYILSQCDHRLQAVESWAGARINTLSQCIGEPMSALDVSDDRLAGVLRSLSDNDRWSAFEQASTRCIIRTYDLGSSVARHDSTTVSSYHIVNEQGILQLGYSKDHRPDLGQVKVMLSTLDPLGLPLRVSVVSGDRADDPLYVPAIESVHETLNRRLLHVGDSKMAAVATRARILELGDCYLCPLPEKQYKDLPVPSAEQPFIEVHNRANELIAHGYELSHTMSAATSSGDTLTWNERRFMIRSVAHAERLHRDFLSAIEKAKTAIETLNERKQGKRRRRERAEVDTYISTVLKRYNVSELLAVTVHETNTSIAKRAYKTRAAVIEEQKDFTVTVEPNTAAIASASARLGWRLYATNDPEMTVEKSVEIYRAEIQIERGFHRLKGQPLALSPMFLQREDHIIGLIRLLTIALRLLSVVEHRVRTELAKTENDALEQLSGQIRSARPTTERMLKTFMYITLTIVQTDDAVIRHLTPLHPTQQRILQLLGLPPDTYLKIENANLKNSS
jgi:transposase